MTPPEESNTSSKPFWDMLAKRNTFCKESLLSQPGMLLKPKEGIIRPWRSVEAWQTGTFTYGGRCKTEFACEDIPSGSISTICTTGKPTEVNSTLLFIPVFLISEHKKQVGVVMSSDIVVPILNAQVGSELFLRPYDSNYFFTGELRQNTNIKCDPKYLTHNTVQNCVFVPQFQIKKITWLGKVEKNYVQCLTTIFESEDEEKETNKTFDVECWVWYKDLFTVPFLPLS